MRRMASQTPGGARENNLMLNQPNDHTQFQTGNLISPLNYQMQGRAPGTTKNANTQGGGNSQYFNKKRPTQVNGKIVQVE